MSSLSSCGLDFGTTNSTIAIVKDGQPLALDIDPLNSNPKILKSLIYLNPGEQRAIGHQAIDRYLWDIKNIPAVPPKIIDTGRKLKVFKPSSVGGVGGIELVPELVEVDVSGRGRLLQSLKSVLTSDTFTGTTLFNHFYTLEDLLTELLSEIKIRAEKILNYQLDSVTLGRPVRYVGSGKETLALDRMRRVGERSGFKNIDFEYEPVGAALHYGLNLHQRQYVLVFDFGGGTLDVCIMSFPEKKIIAVSGRPIGGDLLNSLIVQNRLLHFFGSQTIFSGRLPFPRYFISALTNWYQISLFKTVRDLQALDYFITNADDSTPIKRLRDLIVNDYGYLFFQTVDRCKIKLSTHDSTIFKFSCADFSISQKLLRSDFENIIYDQILETQKCLDESLSAASLTSSQIGKVIVTGGSSKIPVFMNLLIKQFGLGKLVTGNRFTAVALGLALKSST